MSHGCVSNVNQTFSRVPPYTAKCFAAVDIKKDEEILTSYLNSTFSTTTRRKKLKESWYFDCLCQRCQDPSENGSFLGGVTCLKCKEENKEDLLRFVSKNQSQNNDKIILLHTHRV